MMTARRLVLLLFWMILASSLYFNSLLVLEISQVDEDKYTESAGGMVSARGSASTTGASANIAMRINNPEKPSHGTSTTESSITQSNNVETKSRRDRNRKRPPSWLSTARHEKRPLSSNFSSPVADIAPVCVTKQESGRCILAPCQQHDTAASINQYHLNRSSSPQALHYQGAVWRANNIRGSRMMVSGSASAGSGCALSHKYKFIYVHVLKSGGITMKSFLKRALCGTTEKICPTDRRLIEIVDCASSLARYPDYFVFSFVRNPFARLFSGYSMAVMFEYGKEGLRPGQPPLFSFQDFVLNRRTRSRSRVSTSHYIPQASFLFDRNNCPVFDYVGRLDHLDEDWQTISKVIQSPELEHALTNGTLRHEEGTAYGSRNLQRTSLAQAYSVNEKLIGAAAREYARDFELFGYNATTLPAKK